MNFLDPDHKARCEMAEFLKSGEVEDGYERNLSIASSNHELAAAAIFRRGDPQDALEKTLKILAKADEIGCWKGDTHDFLRRELVQEMKRLRGDLLDAAANAMDEM